MLTNRGKTVLYTGVTNDLKRRLSEHAQSSPRSFTGKYKCYYLIYWEWFQFVEDAIAREKEIKGWNRSKKEVLIARLNPNWDFLNDQIMED
jgi:putative endonuclease